MKDQLTAGVGFLAGEQREDGGFVGYSSPHRRRFVSERTYCSVFPAALILSCLCELEETSLVTGIRQKLVDFLLSQKSEHWSFNYWARESKEAKERPYPDDLDDTFCALAALMRHDDKLIDGAAMAKIVTLLTAVEQDEGGPYRTWLVPDGSDKVWRDVDLAVNSNVAYFLSLHEVDLSKVTALVEGAVVAGKYQSPYYPSEYPIIYFMARWYRGGKVKDIQRWLLKKQHAAGNWGNPLPTALAVISLLNFGTKPEKVKQAILYLQKSQNKDGSWPAAAFCLDPAIDKQPHYAGSKALTTAFCLEALIKYEQAMQKLPKDTGKQREAGKLKDEMYRTVVTSARARFLNLDGSLQKQALATLAATIKRDKDQQIVLLPYSFRIVLGKRGQEISDELVEGLGLASLYGWMAYTIYDDFLDEEGEPQQLPVANVCLRELTVFFSTAVPSQAGWPGFFHGVMDCLEAANAWEVEHCRVDITNSEWLIPLFQTPDSVPDYGDLSRLAQRSLGHALGPAAILFWLGFDEDSAELKSLMRFFEHYLIARQLNDDAHDWEADLRRGQINVVGAELLCRFERSEKSPKGVEVGFKRLQKLFWHEVVVGVCHNVLRHTKAARQAIEGNSVVAVPALLDQLLIPVERSAQRALTERTQTMEFLAAYEKQT